MEKQATSETQYAHEKAILEWIAPEYAYYEKDKNWFMLAGIVAAGLIFYGVIWGSSFMSIAVAILAAVYYLQHQKKPRQIKIILSALGLKIDAKFFPFSSLKSFWIVYNPPHVTTLHLQAVNKVFSEIIIQLGDADIAALRHYLARQIPEEEGRSEGFLNLLIRLFKL